MDKVMSAKKIIAGVVGVFGLGALGYVLYNRSKGSATVALQQSTTPGAQAVAPNNPLAQYEGRGFRDQQTGHIYLVQNGVLRDLIGWSGWDKAGWPSRRYEDLVATGVIKQVDTAFINSMPRGANLTGIPGFNLLR